MANKWLNKGLKGLTSNPVLSTVRPQASIYCGDSSVEDTYSFLAMKSFRPYFLYIYYIIFISVMEFLIEWFLKYSVFINSNNTLLWTYSMHKILTAGLWHAKLIATFWQMATVMATSLAVNVSKKLCLSQGNRWNK